GGEGDRIGRRGEDAANLGGDAEFVALLPAQEAADAMFAQAPAIPGRGIEIADAGVPAGLQRRLRLVVADDGEEIAERRPAKAELRQVELGAPELAQEKRIHDQAASRRNGAATGTISPISASISRAVTGSILVVGLRTKAVRMTPRRTRICL